MSRTLQAPVTVSFDYTRSTGPVLGRYFGGLAEQRFVGARLSDGRVVAPPPEFDPVTHQPVTEFVDLAPTGTVTSWTWVSEPVMDQPFDRPFAFALVTLDGASAPMLQAVDVDSPDAMSVGMRVQAVWRDGGTGSVTDFHFAPTDATEPAPAPSGAVEPLTGIITPVNLEYLYAASPEESSFFRGLAEGRILGQRCPACEKVYVPPRPACPTDGVPTVEEIELSDTGTVTTFCIVNVPFLGQRITPPYVSAYILLDGADIALQHLILDVPAEEVRMGMRVKAVWKPEDEWGTTIENISHFAPTGDPDADFATYQHHL